MKRSSRLVLSILIVGCALLTAATTSSHSNTLPNQVALVTCPTHLVAPYGGMDGWSTINVQANFARALMAPGNLMTCQYRFGSGTPFFGIQKPCPSGSRCVAVRNGFRVLPGVSSKG
ncbi:MAG TPA: hypothetical protein VJU84_19895 [Pyrinomonadaceae bacterium]|nr:hypothetical protein [Pyrinomonadaceae bacterium]